MGLTWTQTQSGLGMLTSVDPSSPLSSRSQLCQRQPPPHQISSRAEIPKANVGFENSPGICCSTSKQRAGSDPGKQGRLATRHPRAGVRPPWKPGLRHKRLGTKTFSERALPISPLKTSWASTRRFRPFGSISDHFSTDKGIFCCKPRLP